MTSTESKVIELEARVAWLESNTVQVDDIAGIVSELAMNAGGIPVLDAEYLGEEETETDGDH